MRANSDLQNALDFVVSRIKEEAERSSNPLSSEESYLLTHLPTQPTRPVYYHSPWHPPVRDLEFEKLCSTAKHAYAHDQQWSSNLLPEWEFAIAVLKLNAHAMVWLLKWAGLRVPKWRWDIWMLFAAGIMPVLCIGVAVALTPRESDGKFAAVAAIVCSVAAVGGILLWSRKLQERHFIETIEELRNKQLRT